jgi:site-specific recombinase XerD
MNTTNTPDCLREATQLYLLYLKDSGKSPRTLYTYGKDLEQIQAFFGSEKNIQQITLPLMGRFLKSPELNTLPNGSTRAAKTIQKTVRVFRQFMMWCYQEEWIESLTLPKCMTRQYIQNQPKEID